MKKTSVLLGIGLLAVVFISFSAKHKCEEQQDKRGHESQVDGYGHLFAEGIAMEWKAAHLTAADIQVIEVEEEVELRFDAADFLPDGFDPYLGMTSELKNIDPIDVQLLNAKEIEQLFAEGIQLEMEAANLSPADIHVLKVEDQIDLAIGEACIVSENTAYQEVFEQHLAMWLEEEIGLGLSIEDTMDFLAELYIPMKKNNRLTTENTYLLASDINVIEVEEDIDLGFNPKDYLPLNFDPSAK